MTAEGCKIRPEAKRKLHLSPHAAISATVRNEISQFARKLKRDHRALFASDPLYRKRAGNS